MRQAECERRIQMIEVTDAEELKSRLFELDELVGSLVVYLQELIDVATGRDLVTTSAQVIYDLKNDETTMKSLKTVVMGLYYRQLMESLK